MVSSIKDNEDADSSSHAHSKTEHTVLFILKKMSLHHLSSYKKRVALSLLSSKIQERIYRNNKIMTLGKHTSQGWFALHQINSVSPQTRTTQNCCCLWQHSLQDRDAMGRKSQWIRNVETKLSKQFLQKRKGEPLLLHKLKPRSRGHRTSKIKKWDSYLAHFYTKNKGEPLSLLSRLLGIWTSDPKIRNLDNYLARF